MNGRFDRKAIAGCVVMGGLALAAVALHMESGDSSRPALFQRDDIPTADNPPQAPLVAPLVAPLATPLVTPRVTPLANPAGTAPPAIAPDDTSEADIAYVLQSVHDSLQRNDLTAAKVLLEAVLAVHSDLPQALALQQELRAREAKQARAAADAIVTASDSPQAAAPASVNAVQARPAQQNALPVAHEPDRKHERTARHAKVASSGKTHARSHQASSAAQRDHTVHASAQRPKSRAEVVAELRRARANGSIPNYSNRHP